MRGSECSDWQSKVAYNAFNLLAYLGQDLDAIPRTELAALHKIINGVSACVANTCFQTKELKRWTAYQDAILSRSAIPSWNLKPNMLCLSCIGSP